jgi:hypothetical protein
MPNIKQQEQQQQMLYMRQNTKSSINLLACSSFSRMPLQKQIRP